MLAIALFAAGSPRKARYEEIDSRRVRELQQLSQAVESYFRERRGLPVSLDSLATLPSVYVESIQDPVTHRPYEYRPVSAVSYELCATFDQPDTAGTSTGVYAPDRPPRFWRHAAGRRCYTLLLPRALVEGKTP